LTTDLSSPVGFSPRIASGGPKLRGGDYLLMVLCCALLFGYVAISGKPLTLHEARLPECAREMLARHNWLMPMNGDRPWLERPPFPHWVMMSIAALIGQHCDNVWSVRLAPALMGLLIVLMVARITARWFGRGIGLMAGLVLATMFEFYDYSTLAEDDIFLAFLVLGAMALFVRMEFFADPSPAQRSWRFFGWRPWPVVGFFVLLGLTNLAKGPLVGAVMIVATLGVYFLLTAWQGARRYLWFWGLLGAAVIAVSWHVYAHLRFPERGGGGYLANLRYDFSDTTEFDEPWWFYPPTLLGRAMPWTPAALVGLWVTARQAWRGRDRVLRFLWCWAIVPIIVLSIPHRKHHHYLVPCMAPWAILAALGLKPIAQTLFKSAVWARRPSFGLLLYGLPGTIALIVLLYFRKLAPMTDLRAQFESLIFLVILLNGSIWLGYHGLWVKNGRWLLAAMLIGFGGVFSWQQTHLPDGTVADTNFLRQDVEGRVPANRLLAIDAAIGPLDFFRVQFYLRPDALLLHNLSYLRSDRIHADDAYVVARASDLAPLQTLGQAQMLARSPRKHQANVPGLALFHLTFKPDLKRYPPPPVSPMQAMMRAPGPDCGPALAEGP
jgi:4-amino-4-deoxy-L-arabinose transferase-like glycosyltransferase